MGGCSFIQERGFDPTMFACDDIWDLGKIDNLGKGRGEWTRHANAERDEICIDRRIYEEMLKCIQIQKQSMYFSHLITDLCRQAKIPMSPIEPFTRPMRSVIGENLYGQFVEPQQKHNRENEQ
ncbi:hypothetical protein Gogos_003554 [Gossypium gossypioides]|uniref:Uncharacterized protein n=1 Tax=Gossypium gossypioides TaxID=34282 RepID=A0A7J9CMX9_GOSGO|nr:hypothetical protein [Gossypium gossypioides]